MAEQTQPVKRRVALKVLKPGLDTRQVVARFEAERQALALMDHPHIAKVFDGGAIDAGRPYFVMELVRGVPVTEFCDQHRLTTRQRLELFVTVCQAVQHAHHKGIIHRDLKPSNVLVTLHDTVAVPKVIDFGIAKAAGQPLTERTLFTGFGQMIGTPLYMSPEQAEMNGLDVDTRSDVYALGVLLYELLTGTTPFAGVTLKKVGLDEMRRLIREEEPTTPSQRVCTLRAAASTVSERRGVDGRRLGQVLRGELDWIVMKALEKDRNRRYESASAFAADVQRYLADEPVLACPPSAGYRLKKLLRRHRVALVTASVVAATLLAATAVSAWQAIEASRARTLAEQREASADAQRRRAEDNLRTALRLVRTHNTVLMIIERTPESQVKPEQLAEWRGQLVEVLEKLKEDCLDDPEYLSRLGQAHDLLANALEESGHLAEAERAFREAGTYYARAAADFSTHREGRIAAALLLPIQGRLAQVQRADGRLAEAEATYTQALRLWERRQHRSSTGFQVSLLSGLARCLLAAKRIEEAESLYRRARQIAPNRPEVNVGLAWFLATRPDLEHRDSARAAELMKKWYGEERKWDLAGVVLGVAQYEAGDCNAAAATLAGLAQKRDGRENGAGFFLAMAQWRLGQKEEARKHYDEAVRWTDKYRPRDVELHRFRAEAAGLLEIKGD
jgi:tetratricopeptide (TPR) repeat protein